MSNLYDTDVLAWSRLQAELPRRVADEGPPATALPELCPWTLDELLGEGAAALRPR